MAILKKLPLAIVGSAVIALGIGETVKAASLFPPSDDSPMFVGNNNTVTIKAEGEVNQPYSYNFPKSNYPEPKYEYNFPKSNYPQPNYPQQSVPESSFGLGTLACIGMGAGWVFKRKLKNRVAV